MKQKVKGLIYVGLGAFVLHSVFFKNAPKVSTYSIQEERSYGDKLLDRLYNVKKDTRKHAIIQIVSGGKEPGSCTAFVVSDTVALTAGHCMKFTEIDRQHKVPDILKKSKEVEKKYLEIIDYLVDNCSEFDPLCQRELQVARLGLKSELAARAKLLKLRPDVYRVMDVEGAYTGLKAVAYSTGDRRDYGLIRGNFKNFKKLPIRSGWHVKPGDILRACGFFGAVMPPSCVDFKAIGNNGFHYACEGVVVPGVSGGPVIDADGYAVGIAISAHSDFVAMCPTIGILNLLTKEKLDKLNKGNKK